MIVPGRVASGESFEYDICYMKALAKNQNQMLRFIDIAILEPKKRNLKTLGILGHFDVVGNMYILTKTKYVSELNERINSSIQKFTHISGGATILPHRFWRHNKNAWSALRATLEMLCMKIIKITRKIILNASFSGIRKG